MDEVCYGSNEPGRRGLVCFDPACSIVFRYTNVTDTHGLRWLSECEALNVVSDDEVLLHDMGEAPLVRIRHHRQVEIWPSVRDQPLQGNGAFAVADKHVLFVGGYRAKGRLFASTFGSQDFQELQAVTPDGTPIPWREAQGTTSFTHGPLLFLHTDTDIYVIDATQLQS